MAVIEPNSEIYLLKSPIELDNDNQLNFSNATAQHNYFNGLTKRTLTNATFQRKDGYIRWPESMENILDYNYCMYRNKNHGNKWFYAFITKMEYANDSMTNVYIKTDVWQTWQFDITFRRCFVDREHVNDDTFGLHTVPEGLETGDFVCNGQPSKYIYAKANDDQLAPVVLFQVTKVHLDGEGETIIIPGATLGVHNGIPQGCYCFGIRLSADNIGMIHTICGWYDSTGAGDAIVSISLVPYSVIGWTSKQVTTGSGGSYGNVLVPNDSWTATANIIPEITRNTTIDGYSPKNNKLFIGDYNYLYLSNNAGGDIVYKWEDFDGGNIDLAVASALEQGGSVKLYPQNSLKSSSSIGDGWTEGIVGAKLPAISWISDYYLNWQAVNGSNIEVQTGIQAVKFGISAIAQNGAMNILDFASDVANTMQKVKEAQMTPPQAKGNVASGDITFSQKESGFTWRKMSIRAEYAKMIDDYFTMFGYKTNRLKVPNINGRANWNYVKTKGCNIIGDIPQDDMQEIKTMFNRGVTIWHHANTFLDYSQSNAIV